MREWTLAWIGGLKRRAPIPFDDAAGILPRFRLLAEIAQHRVDRSLKLPVALANRFLHVFPLSVRAQALELFMGIENQDGPRETARRAGTVSVHPNHIQRLPAEAE